MSPLAAASRFRRWNRRQQPGEIDINTNLYTANLIEALHNMEFARSYLASKGQRLTAATYEEWAVKAASGNRRIATDMAENAPDPGRPR